MVIALTIITACSPTACALGAACIAVADATHIAWIRCGDPIQYCKAHAGQYNHAPGPNSEQGREARRRWVAHDFGEEQADKADDEKPDAGTELCFGQEGQPAILAEPLAAFLVLPPFC